MNHSLSFEEARSLLLEKAQSVGAETLPLEACGYTEVDVDAASPADMDAYYSKEAQQRFGVVGIELAQEHYGIERAGKQALSDLAALAAKLWRHPAGELAADIREKSEVPVAPFDSIPAAIEAALAESDKDDVIAILGSLYQVGDVRSYFGRNSFEQ